MPPKYQRSFIKGPTYPEKCGINYKYRSPPKSPGLSSSSDESVISEDLNLYDPECVCQSPAASHLIKCKHTDSIWAVDLDSKQLSELDKRAYEFKAAGYQVREQIILKIRLMFESTWTSDAEFKEKEMDTVSALFDYRQYWATLNHIPGYPPVSLFQNQTSIG
jgi:hypothetical protein